MFQVITLDHDKYERELNNIPKSHSKSIQARDNMKLRPVNAETPMGDRKARLPKLYGALEENAGMLLVAVVAVGPTRTLNLLCDRCVSSKSAVQTPVCVNFRLTSACNRQLSLKKMIKALDLHRCTLISFAAVGTLHSAFNHMPAKCVT